MELDRIDAELLRLLRKNARMANKDLAARVGIAPSTALERIRRLREARIITGFHAELDPAGTGVGVQAMVAVRLNRHSREQVLALHDHLLSLPEVVAFYHVAGANDFLVHVAMRDAAHLREFALSALTARPEVAHIETNLIFEFRRSTELPLYALRPA